jgi:hypothetical protein
MKEQRERLSTTGSVAWISLNSQTLPYTNDMNKQWVMCINTLRIHL